MTSIRLSIRRLCAVALLAITADLCAVAQTQPIHNADYDYEVVTQDEFDAIDPGLEIQSEVACDSFVPECNRPCHRFWLKAEYLYWHTRGMSVPALVTTSSTGTAQEDAGVLDQPNTAVLFGDTRLTDEWRSGGRFSLGFWFDERREIGLDCVFTGFGSPDESFFASSDQFPILARPFSNVESGDEDSRLLGFPNVSAGEVYIDASTDYHVFEVLVRRPVSHWVNTPTRIVYGYRYGELEDSIRIEDFSESLSGVSAGSTLESFDQFDTRNTFHGFEMGLATDLRLSRFWYLHLTGKVAFGETSSVTTISGQTTATNSAGTANTTTGGLLTQATNLGRFESNSHGVLQDLTIGLQRQIRPDLALNIGYAVHRWIDVVRAGDQIDLSVNPTQFSSGTLVGDARPAFPNRSSDFIAQGITVGIDYVW